MKNVVTRSISGLVYIALIVGTLLMGNVEFSLLTIVLGTLAALEFIKISSKGDGFKPVNIIDLLGIIALTCGVLTKGVSLALWPIIVVFRFIFEVTCRDRNPIYHMGRFLLLQFWVGLPLMIMTIFAITTEGAHLVLAIFIMIWLNDTGAFVVGSTMGRHKLFERLSPKKTWEGFMGGMVFALVFAIVACLCWHNFFNMMNIEAAIALGIIVPLAATFGDLFESKIKRSLNIKDSGNIMPGHGGILDRIDSLLFVFPICMVFIYILIYCCPVNLFEQA